MPTKQILGSATANGASTSAVSYNSMLFGTSGVWATTLYVYNSDIIPTGGTLSNVKIILSAAPGAGKSYTFVVMKNGATTDISIAISDAATEGQDLVNSVAVSAGDTISLRSTPSGTPTSAIPQVVVTWVPTIDGEYIFGGCSTGSIVGTNYIALASNYNSATETSTDAVVPTSGTIKKLAFQAQAAPGAGKSIVCTARKNASDQTLVAEVAGASATQAIDAANSFTVATEDLICAKISTTGGASNYRNAWSFVFLPDTVSEIPMMGSYGGGSLSTSATQYGRVSFYQAFQATSSLYTIQWPGGFTFSKIVVSLVTAPGAGKSRAITLRDDDADTDLTVTISGDDKAVSATAAVTPAALSLLNWKAVPSGTPAASIISLGFVYSELVANISIYDSCTAAENVEISITAASTTEISIDVSSSITTADVVTLENPEVPLVASDTCTVSEEVGCTVSGPEVSIVDTISISESVGCVVEEAGIVSAINIDIYDAISVIEDILLGLSDFAVNVLDSTELAEYVSIILADIEVSVLDLIELIDSAASEFSDLGAEAVETVSVQEDVVAAEDDLVLSVAESSSLSEATISTVSDPLIAVVDSVTVEEDVAVSFDTAVLDEEISVQDSVSLAESTGAEVSDLPGSVLDTVTLDEQVAAVMLLQVEAVDDVTVATAIDLAPPVLEPNIYDSVGVDENISVGSVLEAVVEDVVGVAEYVVVLQEAVATRVISVNDDVLISEATSGLVSDLSISIFNAVSVTTSVDLFWIVAAGVLILDIDIIVPLIDFEMLVPSVDTYIQLPTIDLEVG